MCGPGLEIELLSFLWGQAVFLPEDAVNFPIVKLVVVLVEVGDVSYHHLSGDVIWPWVLCFANASCSVPSMLV